MKIRRLFYIACFVLLFWILIPTTKKEYLTDVLPHTVDVVVARYNEDVRWLNNDDLNKYKIFLYEKGINRATVKNIYKRIELPNVGRCDHTYLYHIIENYDNLADVIIFLPGSAMEEHKKLRTMQFIKAANDLSKVKEILKVHDDKDYRFSLNNFYMDSYAASHEANRTLNPETELEKSPIRPFGKWYSSIFKDTKIPFVWYSGVLIATKESIRRNPIELYKTLISYVDKHSNPEAGHYIERIWAKLFMMKC